MTYLLDAYDDEFYERHVENEPTDATQEWLEARFSSRLADMAEDAQGELECARALMEEDEESDKFTERDEAPLVKPEGPCVELEAADGVIWNL